MNPRLVRACAALIERASPVALVRPPRKARVMAEAGRELPVPIQGEMVHGVRQFDEGDDPRTLEPRLSDLLETDIALEYASPQLGSVLVILDAGLWHAAGLAGGALCALAATALQRAGHPVRAGATDSDQVEKFVRWPGTRRDGKRLPGGPGRARHVSAWLDARRAEGLTAEHTVFVTDAGWTRTDHAALLRELSAMGGDPLVLMLVHDREVAPCRRYRVRPGSGGRAGATPASMPAAFLAHARRLTRATADGPDARVCFLRWSDAVTLTRRAGADLSELLNGA